MALRVVLLSLLAGNVNCATMDCGSGVPLCGTLTLQTGLGSGVYSKKTPEVHGLWPEVGEYGTSQCIKPANAANPTQVYSCYSDDSGALDFETHEWTKHGSCAGVKSADDYFGQICNLSQPPLAVLTKARQANGDFKSMVQALKNQSYPVWSLDEENDQVLLSACAKNDGRWVLAQVSEMPSKCGGSSPAPSPAPSPPAPSPPAPSPGPSPPAPPPSPGPTPQGGSCVSNKHGPKCSSDADCKGVSGCVRCAHSGYCTNVKLFHASSKMTNPLLV